MFSVGMWWWFGERFTVSGRKSQVGKVPGPIDTESAQRTIKATCNLQPATCNLQPATLSGGFLLGDVLDLADHGAQAVAAGGGDVAHQIQFVEDLFNVHLQ